MEMCDRKYMFGDKSSVYTWFKLEWSKHAQKSSTRKNIFLYIKQGSIAHSFDVKKRFTSYNPFKNLHVII